YRVGRIVLGAWLPARLAARGLWRVRGCRAADRCRVGMIVLGAWSPARLAARGLWHARGRICAGTR
ncbi:MAG TPA: hypothetical protein VFI47_06410, partial [Acidimicrobiales bacterium]|nr:hypothetical protein [Acidimicrobiales bacterium]